jgi:hypothetical protein
MERVKALVAFWGVEVTHPRGVIFLVWSLFFLVGVAIGAAFFH